MCRCGRKNNLWNASLPYLTSVSLPPSKENHTVSYVKRVLGGGALIHTGYQSLSNQVKTIHNDCPDITYKICMLHVLEKFKKTHHCLKSKSLCSYG